MDFVPVAAGTAAPLALQTRGADHDLDTATGDSFITVLGHALHARSVAGARSRVCYSAVSYLDVSEMYFLRYADTFGIRLRYVYP